MLPLAVYNRWQGKSWMQNIHHQLFWGILFFTSTSLWQKFSVSQVFLGEICQVEGRAFTVIICIQGVGKWDWHDSSAWSVTRICLWWMPTFAQVCLSPVGPVPLWIYNYIFIRSEIVCLVIKALLWNVNPSGACSEQ